MTLIAAASLVCDADEAQYPNGVSGGSAVIEGIAKGISYIGSGTHIIAGKCIVYQSESDSMPLPCRGLVFSATATEEKQTLQFQSDGQGDFRIGPVNSHNYVVNVVTPGYRLFELGTEKSIIRSGDNSIVRVIRMIQRGKW